jgi:hypothetical protein
VTIHPLPDVLSGFAAARAVLDGQTRDPEAIEAAIDVLDPSEWYQDRIRIREARARLGRDALARRDLGSNAANFAAMQDRQSRQRMSWAGYAAIALAALVFAHVALSAPGKVARTVQVFQQIEGGRE